MFGKPDFYPCPPMQKLAQGTEIKIIIYLNISIARTVFEETMCLNCGSCGGVPAC